MVINANIRCSKNLKMRETQNFMTHLIPDLQYSTVTKYHELSVADT